MKTIKTKIYIRPSLQSIPDNVKEIMDIVKVNHTSQEFLFKCELVMTELLSNIVEHGFPSIPDEKKSMFMTIELLFNKLHIKLEDSCKEWNVEETLRKTVTLFDENDFFSERGRGLKIISSICSNFTIQRNNGNNVTELSITA